MIKRAATPLAKDRFPSKNSSNQAKPFRDAKNVYPRPSLSRNSSFSKIVVPMSDSLKPNPQSADRQAPKKQISEQMRKLVVQWMLEVSHQSNMKRQTVFMAVKMFDHGLTGMLQIGISNVQLLAASCLFMASKYQEIYPESLNKFLNYTANSYIRSEVISMENKILNLMNFRLTFETRYSHSGMVMERELSYCKNAKKLKSLVVFLLELSLLTYWEDFSENELGEAGVFLAAKVLKYPPPYVSDKVLEAAFKLMQMWRENEGGVIPLLFDCEKECFVGGLKLIY